MKYGPNKMRMGEEIWSASNRHGFENVVHFIIGIRRGVSKRVEDGPKLSDLLVGHP
jgi:hypothetical protein